jgi:HPt (histidine-containing phosphotransfer) domain-containing protein
MLPSLLSSVATPSVPVVLPAADIYCLPTFVQRCMADKELAALLFDKFHAGLAEQLRQIDESLAQQDFAAAQSRVHSLKGEAGSLSAGRLHSAAAALQDALRGGTTTNLQPLVQALHLEAEACLNAYPSARAALTESNPARNA